MGLRTSIGIRALSGVLKETTWLQGRWPSSEDTAIAPCSRKSCGTLLASLSHWTTGDGGNTVLWIPPSVEDNKSPRRGFLAGLHCLERNSTTFSFSVSSSSEQQHWSLQEALGIFIRCSSRSSYISFWIMDRLWEASAGGNQSLLSWKEKQMHINKSRIGK